MLLHKFILWYWWVSCCYISLFPGVGGFRVATREKYDVDTLSEWVKSVRSLIQITCRIKKLSSSMSTRAISIFKDPNVAKQLS